MCPSYLRELNRTQMRHLPGKPLRSLREPASPTGILTASPVRPLSTVPSPSPARLSQAHRERLPIKPIQTTLALRLADQPQPLQPEAWMSYRPQPCSAHSSQAGLASWCPLQQFRQRAARLPARPASSIHQALSRSVEKRLPQRSGMCFRQRPYSGKLSTAQLARLPLMAASKLFPMMWSNSSGNGDLAERLPRLPALDFQGRCANA